MIDIFQGFGIGRKEICFSFLPFLVTSRLAPQASNIVLSKLERIRSHCAAAGGDVAGLFEITVCATRRQTHRLKTMLKTLELLLSLWKDNLRQTQVHSR